MTDAYSYLGLRLPVEMHDALRADAEANERSVSQTVRLAVRQYLARGGGR